MAILKVQNGMTGEEAADLLYANDTQLVEKAGGTFSSPPIIPEPVAGNNPVSLNYATLNYVRKLGSYQEDITGIKVFKSGIFAHGVVGGSGKRGDAQLELDNTYSGGHTLLSMHCEPADEEAAISFSGRLDDDSVVQTCAQFVRFVDSINSATGYETVCAIHLPGYMHDNTPFMVFSNNAVVLLAGSTSTLPWETLPADNTVTVEGHIKALNDIEGNFLKGKKVIIDRQSGASSISGVTDISVDGTTVFLNAYNAGDVLACIGGGRFSIANMPVYADNAAALAGGLTAGMLYRTGDDVKITH